MKFFVMIAAGLLGAAAIAPTAAVAAPVAPVAGTVAGEQTRERVVVRHRTETRRHWGNDRRRHGWGSRKVCQRTWYHGRKVTRCRTVRYRR
ncbi:MAG: hypothetical protein V4564_08570 [Pseudomonadota bacterium]|uniref:hypothetical protein n=1 Tax=Sphingomonas sp. ERG5 TaxID=1381597 RepID=UPI00054B1064|nr:hypothetical protein [Sphingomonas sp. ERG5]